jgi:hypothetical protein
MKIPCIKIMFSVLLMMLLPALSAQSATYYISPTGSNTNPGTSARPWLTFSYAINPSRATCGDTLLLMDGTYGDGTSTGKISISLTCTAGNPFTVRAVNQRKAKIVDNGSNHAVHVINSAYIVVDGLYATSTDNNAYTASQGRPFGITDSTHITFRNLVGKNPNRFANSHVFPTLRSQNILYEDLEGYQFHRHCATGWQSTNMVVRRLYCNPRGGRITGGYNARAGLGGADSAFSMYPCRDCILENAIADGTTGPLYLSEINATYGGKILMRGSQVLGSICYKCNYGNGIYINSRNDAGLNYTPQNITVRDVAFIDHDSNGYVIRVSDGVNITLDHVTAMSTPGQGANTQRGLQTDDNAGTGTDGTQNSVAITNYQAIGFAGRGFSISGFNRWSGAGIISHNNATADIPPLSDPDWSNTSTASPGMGNCKVWVPDGAAAKGAGVSGADIGANILYRYNNGVLTTTPLWDQRTGEFPHGAEDADGTNRVPGESLFDIHKRLNVNAGGCPFPKNYGDGDSDTRGPVAPVLKLSQE